MDDLRKQLDSLIAAIDALRGDVENIPQNSDEEAEWCDSIGERLVDAQDSLRETLLLIDDGPEVAEEPEEENDNPA